MPIVNQNLLDSTNKGYHIMFEEIYAQQPAGPWMLYTEKVSTDVKLNEIDVLETMPVMKEWIGEKEFKSILFSNLTVSTKSYEKSIAIKRLDLKADKIGMIGKRLGDFLRGDGSALVEQIVFPFLVSNSGAGPTCYDGVSLFSTSHVRANGTTWSNKTASALSFSTHDTIMQAGESRVDDNNQPLRIAFDTILVGPKNRKMAMEITQSTERIAAVANDGLEAGTRVAAASIPNVFGGGSMNVVVDPRLTGTYDDYYYYLDTTRGPKPLVMFELEAPHPETQDKMDDDSRFKRDEYLYSVECYEAVGAGSPHVCYAGIL